MSVNEKPHDDSPPAVSADAAKDSNQELIQGLFAGLMSNPVMDLWSLVPLTYETQMRDCPQFSTEKSTQPELSKLNEHWFRVLLSRFLEDPTTNLLEREALGCGKDEEKQKRKGVKRPFYASIEESTATSFEVVEPLSSEVADMLQCDETPNVPERPAEPLKRVIRESRRLFSMSGSFVAKLNDRIAVKVLVLKFHGMIRYGRLSILFKSYVPGSTITEVWPTLDDHQKASLRSQLNEIFLRIRQIKQEGRSLGLLDGRGVVDLRGFHHEFEAQSPLYTAAQFEDFIFSYRPWVTKTYVQFLQTLLPASRFAEACVFTHCDVRTDNVMVDTDQNGNWKISGVIDWEEPGFYPAYWEAAKSTRAFLANQENDWYLMQPACIAPSSFPTAWLADRLWEEMIQYLGFLDRKTRKKKEELKTEEDEDS